MPLWKEPITWLTHQKKKLLPKKSLKKPQFFMFEEKISPFPKNFLHLSEKNIFQKNNFL